MWQYDTINGKFIPGTLPAEGNITACYDRLSQEDELDGDSGSVVNQRDFLRKYCEENHFSSRTISRMCGTSPMTATPGRTLTAPASVK